MPKILQLDPHVADLIAAGEVVERPASAVKELTENAIDAQANTVTVEIQGGGRSYLRVTDDGCGIAAEDCLTAFLRHATSKIRTEYDLEAIGTLGFRGEALAAIAAVSRVELMTRTEDAPAGVALLLDAGVLRRREEAGCPRGTTIIVRDLFFNTPARQKFMKRDSAEGSAVFAVVQHAALSHPEISFRFIREGKQELHTPGDGVLKSAVYSVLGRDVALGMLDCAGSADDISVAGFISRPVCCRGSRAGQFFFVNGRYVKSRIMQAALEQAYANQKMVGKFPACVLHITTKLNGVDVNIHPTKTEVKFASEKKLFDAVYYAVKSVLDAPAAAPEASVAAQTPQKPKTHDTVTPNQTFFRSMNAQEFRATLRSDAKTPYSTTAPRRTVAEEPSAPIAADLPPLKRPPVAPVKTQARAQIEPAPRAEAVPPQVHTSAPEAPQKQAAQEEETPAARTQEVPWRMAGEVLNTYIIVERGDEVYFIDKHAAHERMNFDRLKAMRHKPMQQLLLAPVLVHPAPEEQAVLLENLPLLEEFGFAVEDFGGGSLAVRQAPDYLPAEQIAATLGEIAARLLNGVAVDPDAARDEVLHTMACKAAIKGGWSSSEEELLAVCRAVMSGEVKYCPHGRPVAIRLTKKELEKQFKRS